MIQEKEEVSVWDEALEEAPPGLQEFIGTVKEAFFSTNTAVWGTPSAFGENTILVLNVEIEKPIDPADWKEDTTALLYSVGKVEFWSITDAGARIVPLRSKRLGPSAYGRLLRHVVDNLGVPLQKRAKSPFEAEMWVGLRFRFKRESFEIDTPSGKKTSWLTMPVEWLNDKA